MVLVLVVRLLFVRSLKVKVDVRLLMCVLVRLVVLLVVRRRLNRW